MAGWKTAAGLGILALLFVFAGLLFVPRLGIEVDEALVTSGIYEHGHPWYSWHFGGDELPIMLISYLGALKAWMYNVLFLLTPPRPIPLRLPTLLLGAATLWLFFGIVDRAVGRRAAWIGTVLLGTDTAYLLMNTVDYGPVTFQFVFKLAAVWLLLKFHRTQSRTALAAAFFLFGVALWDKAVFAWVLFGLAVAALIVFPGELRKHRGILNLRVAIPAMLLGALPLIIYNIDRPLETLRGNAAVEQAAVWGKSVILTRTLDGEVFFGILTALEPGPQPGAPNHWYQSLSLKMSDWTGSPDHNLTLWALVAVAIALPFLWRTRARRPVVFALIVCFATWLPMVLTAGAGAAAQHVILIWPFHFLAIGAALAMLPWRAAATVTVLMCTANFAVTNHYYADLIRNGPALRWTDAMDPLHRYLTDLHAPRIYVADWGIIETMNLLSEGQLPMFVADVSSPQATANLLRDPTGIFVAHADGLAIHPQERAALEQLAEQQHYEREIVAVIRDRNGRPAFDVFRFRKVHL
jgi:hypothetical protein